MRRRRIPPRRNQRPALARRIEHIAALTPTQSRLPRDPPSLKLGIQLNKTLAIRLRLGTAGTTAGSFATWPTITAAADANKNVTWGIVSSFIANAIRDSVTGALPTVFRVTRVGVWGPVGKPGANLRVITHTGSTAAGTIVPDQYYQDVGTPMDRAKVGISVPVAYWRLPTATDNVIVVNLNDTPDDIEACIVHVSIVALYSSSA